MHFSAGYFQFAKYVDSILETRIAALADRTGETSHLSSDEDMMRASIILQDESCQKYLLLAMEQYINALKFNSKHVYQALPRLLSLWFDFTSFQEGELNTTHARNGRNGRVHSGTFPLGACCQLYLFRQETHFLAYVVAVTLQHNIKLKRTT